MNNFVKLASGLYFVPAVRPAYFGVVVKKYIVL